MERVQQVLRCGELGPKVVSLGPNSPQLRGGRATLAPIAFQG